MARPRLPKVVFALGAVSFFSDVASEMIVPLLPALLATLGGSRLQLGLIQGVSDLAVSLLKLGSGWLSDRQRRRKPWVVAGYSLSALMRPLFALVSAPWQAVAVRTADRAGKGLRSAPRDALLADAVEPAATGRAFGVLRAMDHGGAVCGALLAFALLAAEVPTRTVFALALVPGLIGVAVVAFAVREPAAHRATAQPPAPAAGGDLRALRPFLLVIVLSAFGAGIDLFLLERARELGAPIAHLPLLWVVLHVVRTGLSAPLGALSDRLGRRRVIAWGLAAQVLVLAAFAVNDAAWLLWPLFALHGLHAAFTEGAERGYVADLTPRGRRGTAFGVYHAVHGVAAFLAPVAVGGLWDETSGSAALAVAAGASAAALVALRWLVAPDDRRS